MKLVFHDGAKPVDRPAHIRIATDNVYLICNGYISNHEQLHKIDKIFETSIRSAPLQSDIWISPNVISIIYELSICCSATGMTSFGRLISLAKHHWASVNSLRRRSWTSAYHSSKVRYFRSDIILPFRVTLKCCALV